jgi:sulfatase modifying factor 1
VVVERCLGLAFAAFVAVGILHACGVEEVASADAPPPVAASAPQDGASALSAVRSTPAEMAHPLDGSAPDDPSVADDDTGSCPDGMILIEGMYCPRVQEVCKRWVDPLSSPYAFYRCADYEPSICVSPQREHKRFCIDRDEYVRPGEPLPLANQSWTSASRVCAKEGKRLCLESEWQFACEGEEMRPYPYGFSRDSTICNIDQPHLGKPQAGLTDLRAPISAYPQCLSPYGVHDMSGNVEEWATLDQGRAPERSAMKGAWWLPGKNNCRAVTLGHGETYDGPQVGVRCCRDADPAPLAQ